MLALILYSLLLVLNLACLYFIIRIVIIGYSFNRVAPFVPSSKKVIKKSIELLELESTDRVVDIGSGDGKFLYLMSKTHPEIRGEGIELSKSLVMMSRFKNLITGRKNIIIRNEDVFNVNYERFNKVYFYLTPELISSIIPKLISELKSGSVVVSAGFPFPDDFKYKDDVEMTDTGEKLGKIYKWNVK